MSELMDWTQLDYTELVAAYDAARSTIAELQKRIGELEAEQAVHLGLHNSYLRIRALVPGAFDTPHAPSPETVWAVTEKAVRQLVEAITAERDRVTELEVDYKSSEGLRKLYEEAFAKADRERDAERQRREEAERALEEWAAHWPRWRGDQNPSRLHFSRHSSADSTDGRWTLQQAADFLRTRRAPAPLLRLIRRAKKLINFKEERDNRPPRFIAVVNEYKRGRPVREIEGEFQCSKSTIMRYARLADLPKRPKGYDPNLRSAVIAMYQQKKPIAEISAVLGVSQAYISKTATEEGINRHASKKRKQSKLN